MMRQVKGLLYFFMTDLRYSIVIFWSILLVVLVLSLGIAYFMLGVEDGMFAFGFPFATYINCGIAGFIIVKANIPHALKFGAIRKNIFIALGLFFILYAFVMAFISSTLQSLINLFAQAIDLHTFMFMHPAQLIGEDTWLTRIVIDTAMMFVLFTIFFLLGLLFYRGGLLTGGSVVAIIGVTLLLGIAQGWLFEFFVDLYYTIDMTFFAQAFAFGIVMYGITYFLLRGFTTEKIR